MSCCKIGMCPQIYNMYINYVQFNARKNLFFSRGWLAGLIWSPWLLWKEMQANEIEKKSFLNVPTSKNMHILVLFDPHQRSEQAKELVDGEDSSDKKRIKTELSRESSFVVELVAGFSTWTSSTKGVVHEWACSSSSFFLYDDNDEGKHAKEKACIISW